MVQSATGTAPTPPSDGPHDLILNPSTAPQIWQRSGMLTRLADLKGVFKDGYTPEEIRSVFGRISDEGGPYLVCVWDYADDAGYGGNSQFYAEDDAGNFFEVRLEIHRWLSGELETPGAVDTWVCAPVAEPTDFPVSDDFHNYARSGD